MSNLGKDNPYEILFEDKSTARQTGITQGSFLSHPAFESFNSNGMWVGKFETGYDGAIDSVNAQQNTKETNKIIIKPNVYSWRNIQIGNAFYATYYYQRNIESHIMKNMEWGAVFYLTQSKYGRCKDNMCTEVRFNNNEKYVTGYSANFEPTCGYIQSNETCNKYESVSLNTDGTYGWSYYNPSSQVASTTGNYYGIYDMAGGSWEYVMGVMQSSKDSGIPVTGVSSGGNSGFTGPYSNATGSKDSGLDWPDPKYYDLYQYDSTLEQFQRGKLGDATKELGPFYSIQYIDEKKPLRRVSSYFYDNCDFPYPGNPWFARSGEAAFGSSTGLGSFTVWYGSGYVSGSFRIVLMPN